MKEVKSKKIRGIVTNINFNIKPEKITITSVTPYETHIVEPENNKFCPLRIGDIIDDVVTLIDNKLILELPLFVRLNTESDEAFVIEMLNKDVGIDYIRAQKIYNMWNNNGDKSSFEVANEMSSLADKFIKSKNYNYLKKVIGLNAEEARLFLQQWQKHHNLRRLQLLGLTNAEITACYNPIEEIYNICMKNPYTLAPIDINKADAIFHKRGIPINEDHRLLGLVVRTLLSNFKNKKWNYTPLSEILKEYPNVENKINMLKESYGVVEELGNLYLSFPSKV